MSHGAEQPMSTVPRLPGTGLLLALDPRNPVDLRQTFIRSPDFTYVDAEATRIGEGGLRIVDASSFFGARPPATRIRRKVLALLPEIEGPLVLDFTGVRAASSSFLDELLGRLADELGPSVFAERIAVVGLSDALRDMANVVIHQRLSARAPRPAL
jgi:hypothetical protein